VPSRKRAAAAYYGACVTFSRPADGAEYSQFTNSNRRRNKNLWGPKVLISLREMNSRYEPAIFGRNDEHGAARLPSSRIRKGRARLLSKIRRGGPSRERLNYSVFFGPAGASPSR
jgi:hypothetical protein